MKIFVLCHWFSQFLYDKRNLENANEDCRLFSELVDPKGKNFHANLKYLSTTTK